LLRLKFEREKGISPQVLDTDYIKKEYYQELKHKLDEKEDALIQLNRELSQAQQQKQTLEERLKEHKQEIEELQQHFRHEFRNLANEILEEKSKKFVEINQDRIGNILDPLKEKIKEFEKKVSETYEKESREKISLESEVKRLIELNKRVSEDASKLARALKGDSKIQGDWGEAQLEMILEKAGLQKNLHYQKQPSFKTNAGKLKRPDYIINLPEDKHLVLDSKVSLTAYENYYNAEEVDKQKEYLKSHLASLNKHIQDLAAKNYQTLYEINPPDYVLMFVPLEGALNIALREDVDLFEKALDKNIVLVSTSTLLATLRTISFMWKQENQKKHVNEIARQSGALYDKFVGFLEDMNAVGDKLDEAKSKYAGAMNKLATSTRKGDTIIGRMEKIRKLGANTTKSIPGNLLDQGKNTGSEEDE
jgi:DNA recombination protein RmuC